MPPERPGSAELGVASDKWDVLRDISAGSCGVWCHVQTGVLRLRIGEDGEPTALTVKVARKMAGQVGRRLGLRFTNLAEDQQRRLSGYVRSTERAVIGGRWPEAEGSRSRASG